MEGRFQPFYYLTHGGAKVNATLSEGAFDLLAGRILTRSKSGHFGVRYAMETEGLSVKVESISKEVNVFKADDLSGRSFKVAAGNFMSWVSETPGPLFSRDEKKALAGGGFLSPVFQMPESRKRQLGMMQASTRPKRKPWNFKLKKTAKRGVASMEFSDGLCQAPQGQFNQCAWSCEGNGKKSKACQAEKSGIRCVRRVCNAAGQWGVPTAFASSYKDLCPAQGVRVGECSP